MSDMANVIPNFAPLSAARLKGLTRGALICGVFGAVWMFEAVFFGGIATPAWLTITALFTIAFVAWPVVQLRSLGRVENSAADSLHWASLATPYWTIVAVEWVACAVVVNWVVHIRRFDLILPSVGIIVGLHFLPLAKLFKIPLYYATGTVMVMGVLASFLVPAGHVRNIVACGVMGLSLWTTATVILSRNKASSRGREGVQLVG